MSSDPVCKYHPRETAAWFCPSCEINFCANCVPQQKNDPYPKCSLCRKSMTRLSIAAEVPDFWSRLSLFFLAPLSKNIFLMLALYAVLGALLPKGWIGRGLFLLSLIPFIAAQFELLEKVSTGRKIHFTARELINSKQSALAIKAFMIAAFAFLIVNKSSLIFGEGFATGLSVFFLLGVPASIAIFVMEKNLLSPVNPIKIFYLMKIFNKAYGILFVITAACGLFIIKNYQVAVSPSTGFFTSVFLYLLSYYLITVIFLMVGYLLYQHHIELNYSIHGYDARGVKFETAEVENDMAIVEIYLQEGRFEDAQTLLLKKLKQNPLNYKANEKLILLFAALNKTQYSHDLIEEYFSLLIELGKNKHAADFYWLLDQRGIQFQPASSAMVLALVPFMMNLNQYKSALSLLEFCRIDPAKDERWDHLALLKAKILIEYEEDKTKALQLLALISKRSLNQALLEQADSMASLYNHL